MSRLFESSASRNAARQSAAAAAAQAQISREQLDFSKQQWADELVRRDREEAFLRELTGRQRAIEDETLGWARADRSLYEQNTVPVIRELSKQALDYNTGAIGEELASLVGSDIATAANANRIAAIDEMLSYGVNPSSGDLAELSRLSRLGTGAQLAGAATGARRSARDEGFNRLQTAAAIGSGLPATYTGAIQTSMGAGQQIYNNQVTSTQLDRQAIDQMLRGYGGAISGYGDSVRSWAQAAQIGNLGMENLIGAASALGRFAGLKWGGAKK